MDPFQHYLPSMIAAAAYCLANYTLNRALWVSLCSGLALLLNCNIVVLVTAETCLWTLNCCLVGYCASWKCGFYLCMSNPLNFLLQPDSLYAFTGYTLAEIAPCLILLHQLHLAAKSRPQQAICEKYRSTK